MDPRTATTTPLPPAPTPPPPGNTPPEGKLNFLKSKKGLFIIGSTLLLVIIVIIGMIFFLNSSRSQDTAPETTLDSSEILTQDVKTYPKFQFTYNQPEQIPQVPNSLSTYTLKDSFTSDELASIGARLGLGAPTKTTQDIATFSDITNPDTRGYMAFNTSTGAFEYNNMGYNLKLPTINNPAQEVAAFLVQNFFTDNLLSCDITYNNSLVPDITFVECHRTWEKLGAPLLNLPGTLNIPQSTPLTSLRLGYSDTPLANPYITNVSTGQNGIDRPNDFNTVTVAITPDGTILNIVSNLRFITSTKTVGILSPSAAYKNLTENKADSTIAVPQSTEKFDWDTVFPESGVTGKNADINGFELVYVENLPGATQKTYTPTYIFRGSVRLENGYSVNFAQTIPAETTQISSAGIAENDTLQLQTFTPPTRTVTPTTTRTQTPNTPIPTPAIYNCTDGNKKPLLGNKAGSWTPTRNTYTISYNGKTVNLINMDISNPHTLYLNEPSIPSAELDNLKVLFGYVVGEQLAWNYKNGKKPDNPADALTEAQSGYSVVPLIYSAALSNYQKLIADPKAVINPQLPHIESLGIFYFSGQIGNPCYLSGLSPTIFLYSENNTEFRILPSYALYSEPKLSNNTWTVKANKNGVLTFENFSKDFLYYEFNPAKATFNKQGKGFVLDIHDLEQFAPKLAKEMKLNTKESERLLFELELAIKDLPKNTSRIKISLVPAFELNTKLPLSASPKPEYVNRYHFLVSPATQKEKTDKPSLPIVKRGKSTLVEIGASAL